MSKITLNRVASLINAPTTLNGIISQIESAFDRVLFRDGLTPNQMSADLDMNNKRIYNLPAPQSSNDPVRLQDVVPSVNGISISDNLLAHLMTLTVAATNTISYTLPASVTIGGTPPNQTLTFNIPQANGPYAVGSVGTGVNATATGFSSSNQAQWLVGNLTGSGAAPYSLTSVADTATGSTAVPALAAQWIAHNVNAGAGEGNRFSLMPILTKNAAVTGTDPSKKFYTPLFSIHFANAGDGGSAVGPTYYGSYYGISSLLEMRSGATYLKSAQGAEFDISMKTGSSAQYKSAMLIASVNSDAVKGTTYEAMLSFGRDATTTATWDRGIDFNWPLGLFPFSTSATLIGSSATGTVDKGVDLSALTITTSAFKSTGFNVNGSGDVTANKLTSAGPIATPAPVSISASTYTVGANDTDIIFNTSGTCTVTLPTPSDHPGRELWIKTVAAQAINSASSNVQPLAGGALGTAILTATAGKWCKLKSDGGTAWIVMAGG